MKKITNSYLELLMTDLHQAESKLMQSDDDTTKEIKMISAIKMNVVSLKAYLIAKEKEKNK